MKDYKEISNKIYQELSDFEKSQCSIEIIENIMIIGEYADCPGIDYGNLFMENWLNGHYLDINIVIETINNELAKDKIIVERDLLISIINLIRRFEEY